MRHEITKVDLAAIFMDGPEIQRQGEVIGRGRFENDLQEMGFSKSELKRLVACKVLERIITKPDGKAWRATYVYTFDQAS